MQLELFQEEGVRFLLRRRNAILADDMGLGKTVQAINAAEQIVLDLPILVICPAGIAKQWVAEIGRWSRLHVLLIKTRGEIDWQPGFSGFVVCPYSRLDALPKNHLFKVLILDEAHYVKNLDAERTKLIWADLRRRSLKTWLLTGTPIPNNTQEIAHIMWAMAPEQFPSYKFFIDRYCNREIRYVGTKQRTVYSGGKNLEELRGKIAEAGIMLRRTRSEAKPTMRRVTVDIDLEDWALDIFDLLLLSEDFEDFPENESFSTARKNLGLAKVKGCVEWLEAKLSGTSEKFVLFCYHREVAERLSLSLKSFSAWVATGEHSPDQRKDKVDAFKKHPGPCVFVGTIGACGTGMDGLQCCPSVGILEPSWVPGENAQAEGRVCRMGGMPGVVSYWFQTGHSIDRRITYAQMKKQEVIDAVVGAEDET